MANFTVGDARLVLTQDEVNSAQANGSLVVDSQRTRPLWFDGRFLAARDLQREQNYFLQRQADLGQAAGFGVVHGLNVDMPSSSAAAADAVIIRRGQGTTRAGELVLLPSDVTVQLADLADEENLDRHFDIGRRPTAPARTRSGIFVLALRPVEFTANPVTSYPTSIQGTRTTHDGDIVEATAITLIPFPISMGWSGMNAAAAVTQHAALARLIFLGETGTALSKTLLPLAIISLDRNVIQWVDEYLVRRDISPAYSGLRLGLTSPATQQAFLKQYDSQLQSVVASRRSSGSAASFAATDYFQALPPAGRFPLAALNVSTSNASQTFTQNFFPAQMDIRLSIIPSDELPALLADSQSLPPIDLTLPAASFTDLAVFALVPVPRAGFTALRDSLPTLSPNAALPSLLSFRSPTELLRLYRGNLPIQLPTPTDNASWANAIGTQTYGFYTRARSSPAYVSFTTANAS